MAQENEIDETTPVPEIENQLEIQEDTGRHITFAALRDRFAAFAIDALLLSYVYWFAAQLYQRLLNGNWQLIAPTYGMDALIFHGIFALIVFLYFFIFEAATLTTPGKFCGWMAIRRKDGRLPSIGPLFLRNILRIVDHLLIIFPALLAIEFTRSNQRIGDLIAKTIVIRKFGPLTTTYKITFDNLAPATNRIIAGFIDGVIWGSCGFGFLLLLDPRYPALSGWMVLLLIPLMIGLKAGVEVITETSPGKWLFGYVIATEEGHPISLPNAIIRNLFRLVDIFPFGPIAMALSERKQRIGDLAGGTLVSKQKRTLKGGIGLGMMVVLAGTLLFFGRGNSRSFLTDSFSFSFLPTFSGLGPWGPKAKTTRDLAITDFRFAVGDTTTIRTPPTYEPGETVYFVFTVDGIKRQSKQVWIQEDLTIKYPDNSIGLNQTNIVDYHETVKSEGPIELSNNIELPVQAMGGTYRATITLRDKLSNKQILVTKAFEVRVAAPPSPMLQPSELLPAPKSR